MPRRQAGGTPPCRSALNLRPAFLCPPGSQDALASVRARHMCLCTRPCYPVSLPLEMCQAPQARRAEMRSMRSRKTASDDAMVHNRRPRAAGRLPKPRHTSEHSTMPLNEMAGLTGLPGETPPSQGPGSLPSGSPGASGAAAVPCRSRCCTDAPPYSWEVPSHCRVGSARPPQPHDQRSTGSERDGRHRV